MHFHMHQARAKYGIIYLLVKKILHSKHCGKRCSNGRAPRSAPTHLKTHKSASACVHLCICMHQIPDFLLAPINLRGILNPNPKGILPNCNSRPVCTETNTSKQIQDKQILSACWTSRVTSKSPPLTTKGCWKLMKCTLWNVHIWSSFSLFALNWYQTSKSSVTYTCTNNHLWLSMVVALSQHMDMNGGAFHMVTLMAGKTMLCIAQG
jgi:hypothetical protein